MKTENRTTCWWWRAARRARARVLVMLTSGSELVGVPGGAARGARLIDTEGGPRVLRARDVAAVVLAGETRVMGSDR